MGGVTTINKKINTSIKHELLIKKEYQQLKQYLVDQYPTKEEVNFRKVDITIEILIKILE